VTTYVVDSSVAVKWYVPEVHADSAVRLLDEGYELHAPDLLLPELGNILWKKNRRNELTEKEVKSILGAFAAVPIRIHPSREILEAAVEISLKTARTVYDSFYLALAIGLSCSLVTADDRLFNSLQSSPFAASIQHVKQL
jgi:predicted nucleic acid-binding protein